MSFSYELNFGPHHPSTHGVLRLSLLVEGEAIVSCSPEIGFLHRGIEKILEDKGFLSCLPFLDRIDYLSSVFQEHAFVMAIEHVLKISPPKRGLFIRIIFDELTRISSHMLSLGSFAYDVGCLSLLLYSFEKREQIFGIFETVTGARMHPCYYIPGGVFSDLDSLSCQKISCFLVGMQEYLDSVMILALDNRVFKSRTEGIGKISQQQALSYSLTGPNLRASGVDFDLRKHRPYAIYDELDFSTKTYTDGDAYSRAVVRFEEIQESMRIIKQCILLLPDGPFKDNTLPDREKVRENKLIALKYDYVYASGLELPKNITIAKEVESPRGEFSLVLFVTSDQKRAHRIRLRTSSFSSIDIIREIAPGHTIQDLTAIIASLDPILSDCDR
jgi:NADH-quinone oxidoreductase subunit D